MVSDSDEKIEQDIGGAGRGNESSGRLLPDDRSFMALLWPYFSPYLVYVLLAGTAGNLMAADWVQVATLAATGAALFWFRKSYRFGAFKAAHAAIALAAAPVALACWIGPFYLLAAGGIFHIPEAEGAAQFSQLYFYLRIFNTAVLVAVFEELFVRVYVMGWLHQAGTQRRGKSVFTAIQDTLDQPPLPVSSLPLSLFSVVGATLVFAAGHQPIEYLSAVCYFLFTTWIYRKTQSLWACILIHGLSNLAIALLARYLGMGWLW